VPESEEGADFSGDEPQRRSGTLLRSSFIVQVVEVETTK
jgi:hypothetical protein